MATMFTYGEDPMQEERDFLEGEAWSRRLDVGFRVWPAVGTAH